MKMKNVDIAIVGGGMVGLTFAASLKESSLRIAIIEGQEPDDKLHEIHDVRVSALNRASQNILQSVGAWSGIQNRRCSTYTQMQVWEKDSFARIDFDSHQFVPNNLGHIVENRVVQLSLLEQVKKQDNVTFYMPNRCQSLAVGESEVWLTLDDGQALTAKLLVGADGANSWVRQQFDIPLTQWDYGHTAIVANIHNELAHDKVARQIFTPSGPLAFLPLEEQHHCSIVWSTESKRAERLMSLSDEAFSREITAEFDVTLGLSKLVGERQSFPLKMRYARDFVLDRCVLIGDAAHTIHPLAGQGVNLGLLDAASLAEHIEVLWGSRQDIGIKQNLREYERWRKAEASKMIAAMQGFKTMFSGDNPAKKLIRGVGMSLMNVAPFAKNEMMQRALGLKGKLPSRAKQAD